MKTPFEKQLLTIDKLAESIKEEANRIKRMISRLKIEKDGGVILECVEMLELSINSIQKDSVRLEEKRDTLNMAILHDLITTKQ